MKGLQKMVENCIRKLLIKVNSWQSWWAPGGRWVISSNYIAKYFSENHLTRFPPLAQARDEPKRWIS